jgi:hypothetical protein
MFQSCNFIRVIKHLTMVLAVVIYLSSNFMVAQTPVLNGRDLLIKTLKSINEVKSLKYQMKVTERGKKGNNTFESSVKLNRIPRQLYINIKGLEVLWVQGKNSGKAYINPNSFPYINLSLDPMSSLMRKDQHHTLHESGYDYFASIIAHNVLKLGDVGKDHFLFEGEETVNGRTCYKIVIKNNDFTYVDYKVGKAENLTVIARKLFLSEYMLVSKNKGLTDYYDILKEGQIIKVPNYYAKNITLFIDKVYMLPLNIKITDELGLYEDYNYNFLQVNPKFEADEFTKGYKDYKF